MFGIALVLTLGRALFQLVNGALSARVTARTVIDLRAGIMADFLVASWQEQSRWNEADAQDLVTRHVTKAISALVALSAFVSTAFLVVAFLATAVVVDLVAAILLVISGILLFFLLRPLAAFSKRLSARQILAGRNYNARALEAFALAPEIRSFGVSDQVAQQLQAATVAEVKPIEQGLFLKSVVGAAYQLATLALLLGGLYVVYGWTGRQMTSLSAVILILVRALNQGAAMQGLYQQLADAAPFVDQIDSDRRRFRSSKPSSGNTQVKSPASISLKHVTYQYDSDHVALHDVSLEVERGEMIGVIGPSGSGKSTIVQILLRLRYPSAGHYYLDSTETSQIDDQVWFETVAHVPQDGRLLDASVEENIRFFRSDISREEVESAARKAYIHDDIVDLPDGYDTILGARGGSLSGGQRQRICIARALATSPSILILDEPTSALDVHSETLVNDAFAELRGEVTIFVIAHRLSTLNSCDRILVLSGGKVEAFGTRKDIESDSEFYKKAVELSRIPGQSVPLEEPFCGQL